MIATSNSCRTSWRAQLDLAVESMRNSSGAAAPFEFTLKLLNVGTLISKALGGVSWLASSDQDMVDPRLFFVRGFDPQTRKFTYAINPSFGSAGLGNGVAYTPPFVVQVGVRYLFHSRGPGRSGPVLGMPIDGVDAATVRELLGRALRRNSLGDDPILPVTDLADTLHLTADQLSIFRQLDAEYQRKIDSLIEPGIAYLLKVRGQWQQAKLARIMNPARASERELSVTYLVRTLAFLSADQRRIYEAVR